MPQKFDRRRIYKLPYMEWRNEMKAGILTFHDTTNFGAVLQTVSTYKAVTALGYTAEIINYHCASIDKREIPSKDYSLRGLTSYSYIKKQIKKHNILLSFLNAEANVTSNLFYKDTISKCTKDYDIFIAGSDMLWCTAYTDSDYTYMLDFVCENERKNSFATSAGQEWNQDELPLLQKYLQPFRVLAVRELETAQKLEKLLSREVYHVCDPTMLVKPEIWKTYCKIPKMTSKYCLIYMDDAENNCMTAAKQYCQGTDMDVVSVRYQSVRTILANIKVIEAYSVEDFLGAIANAHMLFTASYHGMLFAIYFHIPFVYYNKDSLRLEGIAKKLGLQERNGNKYQIAQMPEIDWELTDQKRKEFAESSLNVLRKILEL